MWHVGDLLCENCVYFAEWLNEIENSWKRDFGCCAPAWMVLALRMSHISEINRAFVKV